MGHFLIITLVTCLIVIVLFWYLFYKAFALISKNGHPILERFPAVSVIVCYKNAKEHLLTTVQSILDQQYPAFELIVIDDFSADGGAYTLSHINDSRLVLLSAEKNAPGKKYALTQAISYAKSELLLFTDADCFPASSEWIGSMVAAMIQTKGTEIVMGYGPMYKKAGWLNIFVRFETIMTALQYISYTIFKIPYMGVGRNLMYKKSLFILHNGFESHKNVASGDDDLMISKMATAKNTVVNLQPESFVYSNGKNSLPSFLNQKSRHITTSVYYKTMHKALLALFSLSQFAFYLLLVLLFILGNISAISLALLLFLKWSIQMISHRKALKLLDGTDLNWWFPLLDVGIMIYYMTLPIYSLFRRKKW